MSGSDPRLARPLWRGRTNVDALTIACVEHGEELGGHRHIVTKGSYQGAADANTDSAGTHARGGVVDLAWCGHDRCVWALRMAGMAAWHRTPAQGRWGHHIHAVVVGHPLLSAAAAAQVDDYRAGRNGLRGHGPDDGPRITPIPLPVWPWPEEDEMREEDWTRLKALLDDRLEAFGKQAGELIKIDVDNDPKTAKWSLERAIRWLKR